MFPSFLNPSNLKIAVRLTLGMGIILGLLVVVAGAAFFGLSGAVADFAEYRLLARQTASMALVQGDALTTRVNMKDFLLKEVDKGEKDAKGNPKKTTELWDAQAIQKKDDFTVVLNGKRVIDNAQMPGIAAEGPVGLQHHGGKKDGTWAGPPSLVQFKNIYIKELK